MRSRFSSIMGLGLLLSLVLVPNVHSAWVLDGTLVCSAANRQDGPQLLSDGSGGVFVTWYDQRFGISNYDIYAQRVNASGVPEWTANGVSVCGATATQFLPRLVSDGSGGIIIAWWDVRSGDADIYAQRLNGAGVPQWTANGVAVCTATGDQVDPELVGDGSGGVVVVWDDARFGISDYDIFAQRLNASGAPQWAANGVFVSGAAANQRISNVASDGAGGAIVAWEDSRGGTRDIYAQRMSFLGVAQWAINGVAVCTAANDQFEPQLIGDGSGGSVMTWYDARVASNDIYAQRLNGAGVPQWTANGVAVCNASGNQAIPRLATDGSGGAIIAWEDVRSGDYDIYAQRLDASGVPRWSFNGVVVSAVFGFASYPEIAADGTGGAVVVWDGDYGSFAQRLNAYGFPQWAANGVAVSASGGAIFGLVNNGNDAFVVAWGDFRAGHHDIYMQRIENRYGAWGIPEPRITFVRDNAADQGGVVALDWDASQRDELNQRLVAYYSIWRAVATPPASVAQSASSTPSTPVLASRNVSADFHGPGTYVEYTPTATYNWEWVSNQSARYTPGYSMLVATRQDSTAGEPAMHYFQVLAHTNDQFTFWESNVMSGYSVDNLSPGAPLLLTALRVGTDVQLKWNRAVAPDLRDYSIYRATSSGVAPVSINFLANSDDTLATDGNAPASALYYIVTAYDVHANQSAPSNEASVQSMTGIGDTPAISALTVLQNHPNPFNATTALEIGLPSNSDVSVEVFDVAGRRVSAFEVNGAKAGWNRIPFTSRDDRGRALASGVYFYRVKAAGATITKKMVIAR